MLLKKIYLYPYFWWSREFGTGSDQKWPKENKFINHIYLDNLLMMSTPGFWMFLLSILFIDERIRDRYPVAGIMSANAGWASKSLTWKNKNVIKNYQWYFVTKIVLTYCEKNCSSDGEKLLKFEAEGQEFQKFLRSLEQFIQTVKGQNNFW